LKTPGGGRCARPPSLAGPPAPWPRHDLTGACLKAAAPLMEAIAGCDRRDRAVLFCVAGDADGQPASSAFPRPSQKSREPGLASSPASIDRRAGLWTSGRDTGSTRVRSTWLKCMTCPLGKGLGRSDDGSPPKCIRPLASELLLQPGHDGIRAHRSHIIVRAGARFSDRVYAAPIDCFVITSSSLAFCPSRRRSQATAGSLLS
jgi:hypothetical protein